MVTYERIEEWKRLKLAVMEHAQNVHRWLVQARKEIKEECGQITESYWMIEGNRLVPDGSYNTAERLTFSFKSNEDDYRLRVGCCYYPMDITSFHIEMPLSKFRQWAADFCSLTEARVKSKVIDSI